MPKSKRTQRHVPSSPPSQRDYLTVDELTAEFPVSNEWVYAEARDGKLDEVLLRYGKRILISRSGFKRRGQVGVPT